MCRLAGISALAADDGKEALDLARRELRTARPSTGREDVPTTLPWDQAERMLDRARFQQYIDRVVVRPTPDGRPRAAEERAEVFFIGASEPYRPDYIEIEPG